MPSLFEPCGLSQMIAQRYGTLPIVRYTGGLADSVHGYDGVADNLQVDGIGFRDYDERGMDYAMGIAKDLYANQRLYYRIAKRAMGLDRSWAVSAKEYVKLYKSLLK